MKSILKYVVIISLLLCAICAEAQGLATLRSSAQISEQLLADPACPNNSQPGSGSVVEKRVEQPGFTNSNPMQDRHISVHSSLQHGSNAGGASARPVVGTGSRLGAGGSSNPFGSAGSLGPRQSGLSSVGGTDNDVMMNGGLNHGLDVGNGDRQPGQLAPIGKALLPLLLMLIGYTVYRALRRKAGKDSGA